MSEAAARSAASALSAFPFSSCPLRRFSHYLRSLLFMGSFLVHVNLREDSPQSPLMISSTGGSSSGPFFR
ncbi:hypothetical protein, partial [Methanocorpusculum vombati]